MNSGGCWKLIHCIQAPQQFQLLDLQTDPEERRNLYDNPAHAATREELRAELERLRDAVGDDRSEDGTPTEKCTIRIARRPGE